jgi:DNA-binding CsgD family transcriptional regulator
MELLERGPIQLELSRHFHEATEGQGKLLFLGGEAGIGKSALVQRFARTVGARARVLTGACDPLSTPRPLGPLFDTREGLSRRFAELLSSQMEKDTLFRGFLDELAAREQTTVVIFEDVHWADEATLDLLRFLGRRLGKARTLLIATYRNDEVGDRHPLRVVLGDLATLPAVQRLALEPLSPAAVRTLCAGTALDPVRLHQHTGGNPFFVTEVIAAGGTQVPGTVRDAVLARAARLSEAARRLLDTAAVIGFRSEPWLLEAVGGLAEQAVDACLASGMLKVHGGYLVFRHELSREAVLSAVPLQRRVALHRRVLDALRGSPHADAEVARLAAHAEEASDAAAVLQFAPEAGRRAAALGAHREAAAQYARALGHGHALPALERARLSLAYAEECATIGEDDAAIAAAQEVLRIARAEGDLRLEGTALTRLAGWLVGVGRNAESEEVSRESIALLETLPPGRELAEAYATQSGLRMLNRDNPEAVEFAKKALELAVPGGFRMAEFNARNRMGTALLLMGDERGQEVLEELTRDADEAGMHSYASLAYGNLGSGIGELHEFRQAERYLVAGIGYATEHESLAVGNYMRAWYALTLLYLGHWSEAECEAREVMALPSARGISQMVATIALGKLLTRRGDPAADAVLEEALALAQPTGTLQRIGPMRIARAEIAWLRGDMVDVREEAAPVVAMALEKRHPWLAGELLFWLHRAGEEVEVPGWIARPFALQIEGRWEEAAAEWRQRGCPYELAQALMKAGGPENLRVALEEFERLGAKPAAQQAVRRLREMGVRGIPRGPRASTRGNPAGLTPREVEILRLIADGLRNAQIAERLFLSSKTVGHHVSAVLSKLGVHSRTEAAREAARLGLLQDREAEPAK